MRLYKEDYLPLIKIALKEDLSDIGDVTSDAIFNNEISTYILLSKDNGILCGKDIFTTVFNLIDNECLVEFFFNDGEPINKSDIIAKIKGNIKNILKAERTALNFISHLSGISTKTNLFVKEAEKKIKILDTRKTIPGLRKLQKYAVKCGGGFNHRLGLYDMVMIKDNHHDAANGIKNAVNKIRKKWKDKFKIEVETRDIYEVTEALNAGVDRIMLDNMDISTMKKCVQQIDSQTEIEASGNITIDKIKDIAKTGVDFVSIGKLTHSVKAFDFSLLKE